MVIKMYVLNPKEKRQFFKRGCNQYVNINGRLYLRTAGLHQHIDNDPVKNIDVFLKIKHMLVIFNDHHFLFNRHLALLTIMRLEAWNP